MLTPERQWHTSVMLDDFVNQVDAFVRTVFLTVTSKLSEFTEDTMRTAIKWGSYIEEVINSLSMDWQREMLVQALASSSKAKPRLQIATLSRLGQARRWVLSSTLGSAFLDHHPEPRALLKWTMAEYAALSNGDENNEESAGLSTFMVDATDVMRSSAYTAVLSHAYSALMACTNEKTCMDEACAPSASEMSVETAQKRAYASNCWSVFLRIREQRRATDFIAKMATLARTDMLVLEVMCYTLIEPCKTTTCMDRDHLNGWVHGAGPDGHQQEQVSHILLNQVLTFRNDPRLWILDAWLLAEVSHNYLRFADAYLAHLLGNLLESKLEQRNVGSGNDAPATSTATSLLKDVKGRLQRLSSRSRRLQTLCSTALGQSNLSPTFESI